MAKTRHMRRVLCELVQSVRDMAWKESSIREKDSGVYNNMKVAKKSQDILIKFIED